MTLPDCGQIACLVQGGRIGQNHVQPPVSVANVWRVTVDKLGKAVCTPAAALMGKK